MKWKNTPYYLCAAFPRDSKLGPEFWLTPGNQSEIATGLDYVGMYFISCLNFVFVHALLQSSLGAE